MTKMIGSGVSAASILLLLTCASNETAPSGGQIVPPNARETFRVSSVNFCVPTGLFCVIRKGNERAAIRFTEVRKLKEESTGYAAYESYYRADGRGEFTDADKREGTASVLGWGGFHPFSYQKGNAKVHAGPLTLEYNFPSCIWFTPYGRSAGDYGIEIAPTRWTDIRQVDANDPGLRWFRYDASGERSVELRREDL